MRFWPVLLFSFMGSALCAQPATPARDPPPMSEAATLAAPAPRTPVAITVKPTPPALVVAPVAAPAPAAPVAPATPSGAAAPTAAPAPVPGFSIRGQLSLTSGGRKLRSDEAVDAVVYYRPAAAMAVPPALPASIIATERKTFSPRALPITVGTEVRFPNKDPILHNAFSTAKEASFDLGLYGRSEGESHVFTTPGVVRVFCNVHHAMVAHVLVMDTPYYVKPDAQGRFRLANLPPGSGELFVWHERAQLWRKPFELAADEAIPVPLELSKRKVPAHLNKTGQPYRRTRPNEY